MLIKEAITEIAQQLKSNEHIDYSDNGLLDNLSSDLTEDDIRLALKALRVVCDVVLKVN
tara:strand:+ start:580 stop:756 length:177 start_codon:yes stop_codon:yes gene_type:complete